MDHSKLSLNELKGLKLLRERIKDENIPPSNLDKTISIATWNIRHWGQKRRKKVLSTLHRRDFTSIRFDIGN